MKLPRLFAVVIWLAAIAFTPLEMASASDTLSAPRNLTVTWVQETSIKVNWYAPEHGDYDLFAVFWSYDNWQTGWGVSSEQKDFVISNIPNGQEVWIKVRADDNQHQIYSEWSNTVTAITTAPAPLPEPTPSPSPVDTVVASPTPTLSPTAEPVASPTSSPEPSPSPTPSQTPQESPSPTPNPSVDTNTPTPTPTAQPPSPEPLPSPSQTFEPSPTPTPVPSLSANPIPSPTPEPSFSLTPIPTPAPQPTPQPEINTPAPSPTPEPTPSYTPAPTPTIEPVAPQPVQPTPQPTPEPQPIPTLQPEPVREPDPAPEPEPTPLPVEEPPAPLEEPAPLPVEEPAPVEPPTPVVEPAPVEEPPAPVVEPVPVVVPPVPVIEPVPVVEIKPEPPVPAPTPVVVAVPPVVVAGGFVENNPNSLPEVEPKLPPTEKLIAHVQEDKAGVENGGIEFFGTQSQPQVVGEDGQLTPPPPAPGSGDPIPPDAITTTETFIGQAGGVTFNSPDIAVPVEPIEINIDIPGVGDAAQAMADAYVALANIGNDMSPITRKKAKKILAATIVGGIIARRIK